MDVLRAQTHRATPSSRAWTTDRTSFITASAWATSTSDGRDDVIIRHGWWEAPQDRTQVPWTFHPFEMVRTDKTVGTECANIWVDDLDGDGDMDLISSSAHAYGIWWWENIDGKMLKQHVIDKSFSQTHALLLYRHERRRPDATSSPASATSPIKATIRAAATRW